ncbi:unnamed protein product, partial [Prorocentrum cordatum]
AVSLFSAARDASLSTTRRPAPQHELYTFWGAQRDVLCAAAARAQVAHFRLTFCYLRGRTGKHWCAGEVRGGFVAARCEPNSLQFHILMRLMSIVFTPREKISHELLRGGGVWLTHTTATNQAEKFFVPELLGGGGTSRPPSTRHAGRTLFGGASDAAPAVLSTSAREAAVWQLGEGHPWERRRERQRRYGQG